MGAHMRDIGAAGRESILPLVCEDAEEDHKAFLLWAANSSEIGREEMEEMMVRICLRSSERVELLDAGAILLDLGHCSGNDAAVLMNGLLAHMTWRGVTGRVGIGPTGTLAQLALLGAPSRGGSCVTLVSREQVAVFLPQLAITLLPRLYPRGFVTSEIIERLHQYGLQTLGQLARLEQRHPSVLHRQFGTSVGGFLAAVARGHDARSFSPESLPARLGLRLSFDMPAPPERILAVLPDLCNQASCRLNNGRLLSGRLCLRIRRESGAVLQTQWSLRQATAHPRLLLQELRRHLLPLLASGEKRQRNCRKNQDEPADPNTSGSHRHGVEELVLFLECLRPALPEQSAFWPVAQRDARRNELHSLAETLANRHPYSSSPLLLKAQCTQPDAIFSEERYTFQGLSDRDIRRHRTGVGTSSLS